MGLKRRSSYLHRSLQSGNLAHCSVEESETQIYEINSRETKLSTDAAHALSFSIEKGYPLPVLWKTMFLALSDLFTMSYWILIPRLFPVI